MGRERNQVEGEGTTWALPSLRVVTFEIEKSGDQARAEEEAYHEEEGKLQGLVNDQRDPELGVEIGERG